MQVEVAVEKGYMTYQQAQPIYGLSTALTWLRKHDKMDWSIMLLIERSGGINSVMILFFTISAGIAEE
ncbi:hypothetical protein OFY17_03235 [Marinomonas sp. C2222]|uniref:Uncharacterized protein n=1 Tax=Marinomonas sargassi TaxID=2984494 RepID=A0ABT2YPT8_9GAMM|nr:hypothetical protein [Marinomonas sargassi]MCV2401892.1 hypothetical protein [Marinomonas sargassi]